MFVVVCYRWLKRVLQNIRTQYAHNMHNMHTQYEDNMHNMQNMRTQIALHTHYLLSWHTGQQTIAIKSSTICFYLVCFSSKITHFKILKYST